GRQPDAGTQYRPCDTEHERTRTEYHGRHDQSDGTQHDVVSFPARSGAGEISEAGCDSSVASCSPGSSASWRRSASNTPTNASRTGSPAGTNGAVASATATPTSTARRVSGSRNDG